MKIGRIKASGKTARTDGGKGAKKSHANVLAKKFTETHSESFNSKELLSVLTEVKNGNFTARLPIDQVGLNGKIYDTVNQMIANLNQITFKNKNQEWLSSNIAKFAVMLQGQKDLRTMTKQVLSELAQVVAAHHGAFYILQTDGASQSAKLKLYSSYASKNDINIQKEFSIGEGLVGQCALGKKKIILGDIPADYIKISSGLGEALPSSLIILPVLFENKVKAVIELASLNSFSETHLEFIEQLTESLGTILNTIEGYARTEILLAQARSQSSELKTQQEELRITNEELQDKALQLLRQNAQVENSKRALEEKAEQLALTSKYKSEFLANMSHELRSPLNSLLILAQQLYENAEGNLNDKQVRYAKTIFSCGDDLIQLINDILDLSKIESGIISVNVSTVRIAEVAAFVESAYKPIAESRDLEFRIEADADVPVSINTDMLRLNQILKNLLSNAFKFTEQGSVSLKVAVADRNWTPGHPILDNAKSVISFSVSDTGIGIPEEKQVIIFEAFQQAEGSTSRKYGGTGLGLSISRGLVELLGGTIELKSELNRGSNFTVFLPVENISNVLQGKPPNKEFAQQARNNIGETTTDDQIAAFTRMETAYSEEQSELLDDTGDDRNDINADDKVLLVVEDDLRFGKIMIEKAHENGLKAVLATNCTEVFNLVNRFQPMAITLDVNLPATSGWKIIHLLRSDLAYCHIPIHVISGEENRITALKGGARSFLLKPLENGLLDQLFIDIKSNEQKKIKEILVVEDNEIEASQIVKMLIDDKINITLAESGKYALGLIAKKDYDCIILDYTLSDMKGEDFIHQVNKTKKLFTPVIIYSVKDFSSMEMNNVIYNSNSHIMKGVNSIELLLAETVSQLHINYKYLASDKRRIIESIGNKKDILTGKHILVVDDDVRNLFAMTTLFERYNMKVITSERGEDALTILNGNPKIEVVLMDIMMPEMDGYETIQKIRGKPNNTLPIIAVTAKAMKEDREKCIAAGASDYIAKPVKIDQLLSLIRLWFCKQN